MAFGINEETIEPILKEVNEGPCKESPISKEILNGIFAKLSEDLLIKTYKGKKNNFTMFRRDRVSKSIYYNHCKCENCGQLFVYNVDQTNTPFLENGI